jgi:hypothetical protein
VASPMAERLVVSEDKVSKEECGKPGGHDGDLGPEPNRLLPPATMLVWCHATGPQPSA